MSIARTERGAARASRFRHVILARIKNVSLIVCHAKLFQQLQIFLLERLLPMMSLLIFNVACDSRHLRVRIRKRAISLLPLKFPENPPFPVDEAR